MIKAIIRIILAVISGIFLIWFIVPVAWGIWHIGNIVGIILCAGILFRTAFSFLYRTIKLLMCTNPVTKIILRVVQIGSTMVLAYCVIISSLMVFAMLPRANASEPESTAVVLGAQVKPWGPSAFLQQRIDAAEQYLKDNPSAYAVVTGGQGSDEHISEAECMYETMMMDGVDPKRIYREDKATNTDENIQYSLEIIKKNGLNENIAIVTDSYHQFRAKMIAHKNDASLSITPVNAINTKPACIAAYPSYFVREWIAIPVELFK